MMKPLAAAAVSREFVVVVTCLLMGGAACGLAGCQTTGNVMGPCYPGDSWAQAQGSPVLNDFHDAAAKADGARYFAHFAPDAVFLGTDAKERWTLTEFKAFAEPYFSKGKGWTYTLVPQTRFCKEAGDGVIVFDELLDNDKLGRCRGSGVLVKRGDRWMVLQYNLTMTVPNEIAEDVAKMSRNQTK